MCVVGPLRLSLVCTSMDSTGIKVLALFSRMLAPRDSKLSLAGAQVPYSQ
jgi:anti-anti-sigma regulatory factor